MLGEHAQSVSRNLLLHVLRAIHVHVQGPASLPLPLEYDSSLAEEL